MNKENNVKYVTKRFSEDASDEELIWNGVKTSKVIIPVQCDGWSFQKENEPPEEMLPRVAIFVEAEKYHRIIKGNGSLVIKIIEE